MAYGPTHEVYNQTPPFEDVNLFETDRPLVEALEREGGGALRARVSAFGALVGSAHAQALGRDANRHEPELRTHDRTGRRIDEVEFHPAWHEVMRLAMAASVHNLPWRAPGPGAYVARS